MNRVLVKLFLLATFIFIINPLNVSAETISARQLLADPSEYDKKPIIFKGEAIGDIMPRESGQWVNVLDGTAIGVWSAKDLRSIIKNTGSYKTIGDIVEIKGVFNRMCEEHGGDLDIHADEVRIIETGRPVDHPISSKRLQAAILLTIGAILAFGFNLSRSRRYL